MANQWGVARGSELTWGTIAPANAMHHKGCLLPTHPFQKLCCSLAGKIINGHQAPGKASGYSLLKWYLPEGTLEWPEELLLVCLMVHSASHQ